MQGNLEEGLSVSHDLCCLVLPVFLRIHISTTYGCSQAKQLGFTDSWGPDQSSSPVETRK